MKTRKRKNKKNWKNAKWKIVVLIVLLISFGYIGFRILSEPRYMNNEGKGCKPGYYYKSTTLFGLLGEKGCTICPDGRQCPGAPYNNYRNCDIGYYCRNGEVIKCPSGKTTKNKGSKKESDCVCSAGTYASGDKCLTCPGPKGQVSSPVGATSKKQCTITAPAGSYISCNSSTCTINKCKNETYTSKSITVRFGTSTSCNKCTGDMVANNNHTSCVCKGGTYLSGKKCVKCPSGFTSNRGSTSINQCYGTVPAGKSIVCNSNGCSVESCKGNTYSIKRTVIFNTSLSSKCTSCPSGKVANSTHSACVCDYGTYASGSKCVACPKCNGNVNCFSTSRGAKSISSCTGFVPSGKYIKCGSSSCTVYSCTGNTYSLAHSVSFKSGLNTKDKCKSCGSKKANKNHTACE